ncbi:hypothetical protein FI667_g9403, partial [Globisporangium splendens]
MYPAVCHANPRIDQHSIPKVASKLFHTRVPIAFQRVLLGVTRDLSRFSGASALQNSKWLDAQRGVSILLAASNLLPRSLSNLQSPMATSLDAAAETQPPTEIRTPSSMIAQPSSDALKFVETALGEILQAFPQDIRRSLYAKFCDEYDSSMTSHLEPVLRKRLTDDEVRHLMFSPTPAQYRFYAALLSLRLAENSKGDTDETQLWLPVLQKRAMTLFYLKHAHNWDLVVEFVMLDGLQVLADLLLHRDLQVRGQAIDSFVQITSNPCFDWFNDPVGYHGKVLHSKMVGLVAPSSPFLRNLVQNIQFYDPKHTRQLP